MTHYRAHVEVDLRKPPGGDPDGLIEQLLPFDGALGMSPNGLFSVQLTVAGDTLPQAAITAVAVVESTTGAAVIAIELMTDAEFNRREGWTDESDFVTVPEAAEMLGVTRQAIGQRIRANTLPAERRGRDWLLPRKAMEALRDRKSIEKVCPLCGEPASYSSKTETLEMYDDRPGNQPRLMPGRTVETWQPCGHQRFS